MLYEFRFQDPKGGETLNNTGTVSGEASGIFAEGTDIGARTASEGRFTKDTPSPPSNPWAYELPSADGVHAMHLDLPESTDKLRLDAEGAEMTIALWVKRVPNPQRFGGLVGNFNTTDGSVSEESNSGWSFGFADRSVGHFSEGQLVFMMGSITRSYPANQAVIPPGEWTHVAVVYKQDRSTDFYINGEFVGSGAAFPQAALPNTAEIRAGRFYHASGPLNGSLDNLQIFNEALTEDRISQLAQTR